MQKKDSVGTTKVLHNSVNIFIVLQLLIWYTTPYKNKADHRCFVVIS